MFTECDHLIAHGMGVALEEPLDFRTVRLYVERAKKAELLQLLLLVIARLVQRA